MNRLESTPYTHPSMPGTPPADFPSHVVRSPFRGPAPKLVWMDETKEWPTTTITEDAS